MRKRPVAAIMVALATILVISCSPSAPAPAPTVAPPAAKPAAPTAASTAPTAASSAPTAAPPAAAAPKVDFPQKGRAITIIVPFAAGGGNDVLARLLGPVMEKDLGVPVQVVNKVGAGSQVGTTEAAVALPDGHTVAMTVLPPAINIYLDPERKAAFNRQSFEPVALAALDPMVIVTKADGPYKTAKDLVDAAKAAPEKVKMSDSGILSTTQMTHLGLQKAAGVKFGVVHFDGDPQSVTALLGGHIDAAAISPAGALAHVKSGNIRVIGVAGQDESKFLPGAKTFKAQGYDVVSVASRGFAVPAKTPKAIVDALTSAIKKATEDQAFKKASDDSAVAVQYLGPAEYGKHWAEMEDQIKPLLEMAKQQQ